MMPRSFLSCWYLDSHFAAVETAVAALGAKTE
jgi:hypothetical protein